MLALEVVGIEAARRVAGDGLEKLVGRTGEFVGLDQDAADAVAATPAAALQVQPQVTGFGIGQVKIIAPAVALAHPVDGLPVFAVIGDLDLVIGRIIIRVPVDHQAAVLARGEKIQQQPLLLGQRAAMPAGSGIGVEHGVGRLVLDGGGGADCRIQGIGVSRLAFLEAQLVDPHRTLPRFAQGKGEFDHRHLVQRAAGSPGQTDLPPLDRDRLPIAGNRVLALLEPPDVLARIHQLEFGVAGRRIAAQEKVEGEIIGQAHGKRLAGDHPAGPILKLEIQPHRPPRAAGDLGDFQAGGGRGQGAPAAEIFEVVEQDGFAGGGNRGGGRFGRGGDGRKR